MITKLYVTSQNVLALTQEVMDKVITIKRDTMPSRIVLIMDGDESVLMARNTELMNRFVVEQNEHLSESDYGHEHQANLLYGEIFLSVANGVFPPPKLLTVRYHSFW